MVAQEDVEVDRYEEDPEGEEPQEEEDDAVDEAEETSNEDGEEEDDEDEEEEEEEEEEELVDPGDTLKEFCSNTKKCMELKSKFDECEERVKSKTQTEETCAEELLDFIHCQDTCVAKSIFSKLK